VAPSLGIEASSVGVQGAGDIEQPIIAFARFSRSSDASGSVQILSHI